MYKLTIQTKHEHLDLTLYDMVADHIDDCKQYDTEKMKAHIKYFESILEELEAAKIEEAKE